MRPARRIKDTGRASKQDSEASISERRSAKGTLPVFPKSAAIGLPQTKNLRYLLKIGKNLILHIHKLCYNIAVTFVYATVAHLAEQHIRNVQVAGSIPASGSKKALISRWEL